MIVDEDQPLRLSQIQTSWSRLFAISGAPADEADELRRQLLIHYSGAVYRYLLGAVRDSNVADDLAQEFALRFLRGDFRRANPERGRFRDFLKRSLSNLVTDHYRARQRERDSLSKLPLPEAPTRDLDAEFDASWRRELLKRVWQLLLDHQLATGTPYETVLKLKSEFPDLSTQELLDKLAAVRGAGESAMSPDSFRQILHRSRARFGELLQSEVRRTLNDRSDERMQEELAALGLLRYC